MQSRTVGGVLKACGGVGGVRVSFPPAPGTNACAVRDGASGRGVGTAVVKLFAEASGRTLTVDSGEGRATTFVATVPRYDGG